MAKWLAEHQVKYLLSLDGMKEDHDRHRRFPDGRGSFDCIVERLPFLKKYQQWQGIRLSITPEAVQNVCRNIESLHAMGINQFIVKWVHGIPWTSDDLLSYERSMLDVCELYLKMKYEKRHFRMQFFEKSEPGKTLECRYWGCGAGRGQFAVDSNGDIYGCSKLISIMDDHKSVLPLGNVFQGFTRIENREPLLNMAIGPRKKCAGCGLQNFCSGGCPATNVAASGSIFVPPEIDCRFTFIHNRVFQHFRRRHGEVFGEPLSQSQEHRQAMQGASG